MPRTLTWTRSTLSNAGILVATLVLFVSHAAAAQSTADVVRGRITDDSSRAIAGATVIITRGPDRLVKQDTTDASGAFSLRFDPGTGDYLVFTSATGYASARRRVQRVAGEHEHERELVANFILKRDVSKLATIDVRASKPTRASDIVNPFIPEPGSAEKWEDGVSGQISPMQAGDLNAVAGTMSNVTMTNGGASILGSGAESNLTTLNGSAIATTSIPRAAQVRTRVTSATFDPTRGGFSGVNTDLQLAAGDRFYQNRRAYLTLEPSALQFTDAVGRSTGVRTDGIRASVGADGELIRHVLTYNVAMDFAHYVNQSQTLLNATDNVFARAGVARDSIARLISIAAPLGISLTGGGVPSTVRTNAFTWIGRLDDSRDTLNTHSLTTYATINHGDGGGLSPLSAPSSASKSDQRTLGAQLELDNYVGSGRRVLTETRLSASTVRSRMTPYEQIPAANVLVLSPGIGAGTNASDITLGGGQFLSNDSRWTVEGSNLTFWNTDGRRNHFKAQLWGRLDGLRQSAISNQLGSYSFNSLSDLASGNASSYSRTLSQPTRSGTVWNAATAIAHQWSPSRTFSVLYGVRLQADGFADSPPQNGALENALGVRTNVAPSRLQLSPRAGFSYTYSRARVNYNSESASSVGTFYRNTVGVIRGGIGEFRDLLQPGILANASASTGLANGTARISCIGSAVPYPDWSSFANDPGTIPTSCADGSGILADFAPPVSLISPSYDVPRSWRASVDWSSNIGNWLLKAAALGSYDLSQPSTIDVNFNGTPQFTLAGEDNRPVFVSPAAVDAASGSVSPTQARLSPEFGRVAMRTSDLRGYGGQLTTTVTPDITKFKNRFQLYTSLSYTLQDARRQYRGFDGAAFGDPRLSDWAPSNNDARHILVFSLGFGAQRTGTITMFARAQSGLPFTPVVQGDINGDGLWGDRAFVPNPTLETDPALATQLRSLMTNGSSTAKRCLRENLGQIAPRNGCRGPWTALLNMQWNPPFPSRWASRVTPTVYFANVLGGVDQLLHGNNLHGWGAQTFIDPVLLVARGFDPATKQFKYNVNPRFADTRSINTLTRNPFRITIDFSFILSVDYNLQQLRRAIEPVHGPDGWTRRSADSIVALYLRQTSDVYKLILANSDSLFLTRGQIAALQQRDSIFHQRIWAVYRPLGNFLAAGRGRDPGRAELDSVKKAKDAYQVVFWEQPEIVDSIITPLQREMMPTFKNMLTISRQHRKNYSFGFGYPVEDKAKNKVKPNSTEKKIEPAKP